MDPYVESRMSLQLVEDIDSLASIIVDQINDKSVLCEAKGIAQYMLHSRSIPMDRCKQLLQCDGSTKFIAKLLDNVSSFLQPTPQPLGVNVGSHLMSQKIQTSLDVKHLLVVDDVKVQKVIKPVIKMDMLYSHKTQIWIRFFSKKPLQIDNPLIISDLSYILTIHTISDDLYEIYFKKTGKVNKDNLAISMIINFIDSQKGIVIFCSELKSFHYDILLFLSNFVKFMYCYIANKLIFNPKTCDELNTVNTFVVYAIPFYNSTNISSTLPETHGPFIAYSGERPKSLYSKFKTNTSYINEGTRAMLSVDRPSDIGAHSNYIEIVNVLDTSQINTLLDNIV